MLPTGTGAPCKILCTYSHTVILSYCHTVYCFKLSLFAMMSKLTNCHLYYKVRNWYIRKLKICSKVQSMRFARSNMIVGHSLSPTYNLKVCFNLKNLKCFAVSFYCPLVTEEKKYLYSNNVGLECEQKSHMGRVEL